MKFTDDAMKQVCRQQLLAFQELCDRGQLNGGTAVRILGISRSRWTQLLKEPDAVLTATPFLNLMWALQVLPAGFDEGWLPASSPRGKGQQKVLERLQQLAAE